MSLSPRELLRAELKNICEYHVPNSEGYVKLDAMESPYSLPTDMRERWLKLFESTELNRYPDPNAIQVKQAIRREYSIPDEQELIFGNGSDELIQLLIMAIAKPSARVLTVTPSFSMYKLISQFIGVGVIEVPLTETFSLQIDRVCDSIHKSNPSIVFLACPNNPTGTLWSIDDVEQIIQISSGLVVIDEAYAPFASYSMMSLVNKYQNALILRTFSKMGLAGLRFGWMAGASQWINELNKLRLPYNINTLTQVSVLFALQNITRFNKQAIQICRQREVLFSKMEKIEGLRVFPSEANFILLKVLKSTANEVFSRLLDQKVMIKNVADDNLLGNCLRVTVGTEKENELFLTALKKSLD